MKGPGAGDGAEEGPPEVFARLAESWRPAPGTAYGRLDPWPARALAALLDVHAPAEGDAVQPGDAEQAGDALPPLWHEVYLRDALRIADLGQDGHPRDGALLPPLPRRRRMFGGGRIAVHEPLRIGERVRRTDSVTSVRTRRGRSGWLLLVTERRAFDVGGAVRVVDERDIVYRIAEDVGRPADGRPGSPAGGTPGSVPLRRLEADERLLMLTSALTYNPHRIHYDRDYAVRVEGYPDLVVHGPLLALEAIEAARSVLGRYPAAVDYRLTAPALLGAPVAFAQTGGTQAGGGQAGNDSTRTETGSVRVEGSQRGGVVQRTCIRLDARV